MSQCFIKQMCKKKSSFYRKGLDSLINSCKFVITILGVFFVATVQKNVDGYEKHAMPKPHPVSSASHLK